MENETETRTYRLTRVDAETARSLVRSIDKRLGVDEVYVRGIADAVRVSVDDVPSFVPDDHGYFEDTVDDFEGAVAVLPSLTRFVAYSDGTPVLSWREDGGVYLRATPDGALLDDVRDEGLEPKEASGTYEGVMAEEEGNEQAEKERKERE